MLRLAAAILATLVLPGVLVVRIVAAAALPPGVRLGAAVTWSLVLVFLAQTFAFVVHGSLVTTGLALAALEAVLLLVSWHRSRWGQPLHVPDRRLPELLEMLRAGWALFATIATGSVIGGYIWWARSPITGDALEHLARTRKLAELSSFDRVGVTELFVDAGLHPGYAFPLWHAAMALVARAAGVDSAVVIQLAPAVLTPLALVMVFGMGAAVFGSRAAGFCTVLGQVGLFGWAAAGVGAFSIITGPAIISLIAMAPALLGVVFAYLDVGGRAFLLTVAASSFVLTVSHPTYTVYVVALLVAFCLARWLLGGGSRADVRRGLLAIAATSAAAGGYLGWLAPVISSQPSVGPPQAEVDRQLGVYANQLNLYGDLYAMAPEAVSRAGPICVIGLAGVGVALLGARRRWGAFVLSGAGVVLLITLVPALFTTLSDAVSVSQARRLVNFIPFALAFAGVALVAARLRLLAVGSALVAGILIEARYPGDFTYAMSEGGGPAWPTWLAVLAVAIAALVLPWLRGRTLALPELGGGGWAVAVAGALVLPVAVLGLAEVTPSERGRSELPAGLRHQLLEEVPAGAVVFSDDKTAYQTVAFAPVYVNTAVGGHVWDRRVERHDDAVLFFAGATDDSTRLRLLEKYDVDFVLARVSQVRGGGLDRILARTYADRRFVLFEVRPD